LFEFPSALGAYIFWLAHAMPEITAVNLIQHLHVGDMKQS